jgi:ketosteroid isomerase-like protein
MSKLTRNGGFPAAEAVEDAAVVRAMYRALEDGDALAFARRAAPEIEWIDPLVTRLPFDGTRRVRWMHPMVARLSSSGTRRGLPAVVQSAFRRDADGTGPRISAETFLEFGDGVLVAGRLLGQGRAEDEPHEAPFLHECFVRGGKVVRIREYPAEREKGES